jgi:hypothetical protein
MNPNLLQGGGRPNGRRATRALALHQLKWRGSEKGVLGVLDVMAELLRASGHVEGYRKRDSGLEVCLVFVVLGEGHTDELGQLMGTKLGPGQVLRKKPKVFKVPKNITLIIPSKGDLRKFLGRRPWQHLSKCACNLRGPR